MIIEFTDNSSPLGFDSSSAFSVYFETSVIYIELPSQEISVEFTELDSIPIELANILRATNEGETWVTKK